MSEWRYFGQTGPVLAWATPVLAATRLPHQPNVILVSRHDLQPPAEEDIQTAKDEFFPDQPVHQAPLEIPSLDGRRVPCVRLYTGKGYDEEIEEV